MLDVSLGFFFQDFRLESTTVEYGGQTLKGAVESRFTADTRLRRTPRY